MTRVGIIGCGTIGTELARVIERDYAKVATVIALVDRQRSQALRLQHRLTTRPPIVSLPELIRNSQLVIEAASVDVASRVASLALAADRDVLIMSAGGLLARPSSWQRAARRSRGRLHVPSGGLCGIDGLKALAVGPITRVQLTTRKPPRALASAPYVRARYPRLARLRRPQIIFTGSPSEAVKAFPQNINVAATMALAVQVQRHPTADVVVRIVADPTISRNVHELEVKGDCGRIQSRVESRPSAANPKTSEVAIRSAIATLKQLFAPVRIGT